MYKENNKIGFYFIIYICYMSRKSCKCRTKYGRKMHTRKCKRSLKRCIKRSLKRKSRKYMRGG